MNILLVSMIILSSAGIALTLYGWVNRCPRCKSLFARRFSIELVDRDLLRKDSWELHLWRRNLLTDFKPVPFKRIFFVRVYVNRYRCKRCGYEFKEVSQELSFKDIGLEEEES